jgi:hypothetical protein
MSLDLLAGLPDLGCSAKRVARQGETVMALHQTSSMAWAMVASAIQACQWSMGSWLVMMVALLAARSSMISSRSARVWLSVPVPRF